MSHFLWIEDFENSTKTTAAKLFGNVVDNNLFTDNKHQLKKALEVQGVFIELSFQDGLNFIRNKLNTIDYIILDIDLPAYSEGDEINLDVLKLLQDFQGYLPDEADETRDEKLQKQACNELKKIAGFYLYTELVVELGFPKQHILFCSNHGENTLEIQHAFKNAKISLPQVFQKSNSEVQAWIEQCYENPYSRLRRGIIEGCQFLKKLNEQSLLFNKFIPDTEKHVHLDEMRDYLDILENFLPLREPDNEATLYKLFVRTLVHEWEATEPRKIKGLARVMKTTRNWITHNPILFNALDEKMLAYLFIINMRSIYNFEDTTQTYEIKLLKLFDSESLPREDFETKNAMQKYDSLAQVNKAYCDLKNLVLKENHNDKTFSFVALANNIQESSSPQRNDKVLFSKLLYQMFWLNYSYPYVDTKYRKVLEIKFNDFNYGGKHYLFEIARHIYNRSFIHKVNR